MGRLFDDVEPIPAGGSRAVDRDGRPLFEGDRVSHMGVAGYTVTAVSLSERNRVKIRWFGNFYPNWYDSTIFVKVGGPDGTAV